jgi:hypothetical protein
MVLPHVRLTKCSSNVLDDALAIQDPDYLILQEAKRSSWICRELAQLVTTLKSTY